MRSSDYHRQAKIDKAIDKTGGVYPGGNGEDYLHSGLPGVGIVTISSMEFGKQDPFNPSVLDSEKSQGGEA